MDNRPVQARRSLPPALFAADVRRPCRVAADTDRDIDIFPVQGNNDRPEPEDDALLHADIHAGDIQPVPVGVESLLYDVQHSYDNSAEDNAAAETCNRMILPQRAQRTQRTNKNSAFSAPSAVKRFFSMTT